MSEEPMHSHIETLITYRLGSTKFTAQNDLYWEYLCKRVVILIETKLINNRWLQTKW